MSEPSNRKKGGERLAPKGDKPPKAPRERHGRKTDGRTRQQKLRDRAFIAVTVIAAVIVVVFVAAKLIFVKPSVPEQPVAPVSSKDPVEGLSPNPHESSGRKEDFFTFLVVGRDTGGGGNTDTIMLVAYDVPSQKLNVMSIPRDTMVNIPYDIKRINAVYNYNGTGEKGIDALYKEVSQLVGFRPDFEIVVEWEGFGKLVDAIGGVDFDVPLNMYYDDPTQDLHIHIKKGMQHLNGEQAMQVIRFRKNNDNTGYVTGDIGRIETQQAFMKEVISQCLSAKNIITNVGKYVDIFMKCVQTDLTVNNLAWFAQQAITGGLQMENVNFITMPGNYNASAWSRTYSNYQSYVTPSGEELVALVNESFNPYLEDVTITDLDIMSVNKNGSLSSTTGTVEDSKSTKAPAKPAATPKPTEPPAVQETPVVSETVPPETSAVPSGAPGASTPPGASTAPGASTPPTAAVTPQPGGVLTPPPAQTEAPATAEPPTATPQPEPTPNPNAPPEGIPL